MFLLQVSLLWLYPTPCGMPEHTWRTLLDPPLLSVVYSTVIITPALILTASWCVAFFIPKIWDVAGCGLCVGWDCHRVDKVERQKRHQDTFYNIFLCTESVKPWEYALSHYENVGEPQLPSYTCTKCLLTHELGIEGFHEGWEITPVRSLPCLLNSLYRWRLSCLMRVRIKDRQAQVGVAFLLFLPWKQLKLLWSTCPLSPHTYIQCLTSPVRLQKS